MTTESWKRIGCFFLGLFLLLLALALVLPNFIKVKYGSAMADDIPRMVASADEIRQLESTTN